MDQPAFPFLSTSSSFRFRNM